MADHLDAIRVLLSSGPRDSPWLQARSGLSQPTVSRALAALGEDAIRIGAGRSTRYALRDAGRGVDELPVYLVDDTGRLHGLGTLVPVRPEGFVMRHADGRTTHSEGLPWWLADMRPQGYLGRAYAARFADTLGLPVNLSEWTDAHALRALVAHGQDRVGNLLLGDAARERFLATPVHEPIALADKAVVFAERARQAGSGDSPGTSAGGEQPKFTACVAAPEGPCHVLVKFTVPADHTIAERWRDLLLSEHLALTTLREAGVDAARTEVLDHEGQRFLEVERFDRVGEHGRRALLSLASLDDEFVGQRTAPWPVVVQALARAGQVREDAVRGAALLHAFGTLIGNTDMHAGNLSFIAEAGRPCALAPAYDMLPMGFAPTAGGALQDTLGMPQLASSVPPSIWRQALDLARGYGERLARSGGLSPRFTPCLHALEWRQAEAAERIARLAA
jgi:hypothetical protein